MFRRGYSCGSLFFDLNQLLLYVCRAILNQYKMKRNLLITCVMLLFAVVSMAQNKITVSGVVTDKTGETVIGASVRVKGQENMGTITDIDGKYQIPGVPANATLIFSYIGMKEQEVALNGRSTVNLMMEEDSQLIEEVVVVGYGSAKKRDLTGSIVTVKAAEIASNHLPILWLLFKVRSLVCRLSIQDVPGRIRKFVFAVQTLSMVILLCM